MDRDIDIEALDALLEMMNVNNVASFGFDENGRISYVNFKDNKGESSPTPTVVKVDKDAGEVVVDNRNASENPSSPPLRGESDIELALNPPNDVRFPVDNGKD